MRRPFGDVESLEFGEEVGNVNLGAFSSAEGSAGLKVG